VKQPNWKTPLVLSAALFGVGTFAYWLQYSHKPKADKAATQSKKPIALPSDDTQIAMVRIKSNRGLIELKCESMAEKKCNGIEDGRWVISNPTGPNGTLYPTDLAIVKEVINNTNNATAPELIDLTEDPAEKRKSLMNDYGLSDEKRTSIDTQFIEFITTNADGKPGKRFTAWFGVEHPLGDKTFVASAVDGTVNDQTIYLISNFTKNTLFTKTVTNFRDKSLFKYDRSQIDEFTGNGLTGKKNGNLWTVNQQETDYERVATLMASIVGAKATDFADASMIKGLKTVLSYQFKVGNTSNSIQLFEKVLPKKSIPGSKEQIPAEKRYYATTSASNEVFVVEPALRGSLDKKIGDLRSKILLTDAEKVTATKLKAESKTYSSTLVFESTGGNWKAKDASKNLDPTIASKLIGLLAVTRIQDFVSPAPAGQEIMQLTIGDDKKEDKFKFSFYSVKGKLYAKNLNSKSNEAFLLEDAMMNALPKDEKSWKMQDLSPTPSVKTKAKAK
jgi:hypothetical protein